MIGYAGNKWPADKRALTRFPVTHWELIGR